MPRPRPYTDDQLRDAVAASTNLRPVHVALGTVPGGYQLLRRHIARLHLDTSHMTAAPVRRRRRGGWTDDDLTAVVARVTTVSDVLRELGYESNGGMHRFIKAHIGRLGADTSHFVGQASNRGRSMRRPRLPLAELLVQGSCASSSDVRRRLLAEGIKAERCEHCGLSEWQGMALPLQLDHINGDHTDNRLENLRILCGNCHSQTDTWCARGRKT